MSFSTPYAGTFAYKGIIPSSFLNTVNLAIPNALDKTGDNASSSPSGGISGLIEVLGTGGITFDTNALLTMNAGASIIVNSGAGFVLEGPMDLYSPGVIQVNSGTSINILTGGKLTAGTITMGPDYINLGATATLDASSGSYMKGIFSLGNGTPATSSSFNISNDSDLNLESGSYINCISGSYLTGSLNIGTGGVPKTGSIQITSNSNITLQNGSSLYSTSGSNANLLGNVGLSSLNGLIVLFGGNTLYQNLTITTIAGSQPTWAILQGGFVVPNSSTLIRVTYSVNDTLAAGNCAGGSTTLLFYNTSGTNTYSGKSDYGFVSSSLYASGNIVGVVDSFNNICLKINANGVGVSSSWIVNVEVLIN